MLKPRHSEQTSPVIIPRPEHNVSRSNISKNALKVLYRLRHGGHQGFLVGGGVRDLLLGREPKDFDVVTDARPEQVRKLFRNCRLIGRRFRLAHIHFGREVVEVATFRAAVEEDETEEDASRLVDDTGRILRDNVYGSIDEDVWRRDFTANALYYNIEDFSIWDYVGGVRDIQAGTLRVIGDASTRYQEDPVRMLRAVRFAAKLGFKFHRDTEAPLSELGELLDSVPPARLLDEIIKLFLGGCGLATFELLRHYDLFKYLFPMTDALLSDPEADAFRTLVTHCLSNSDERVTEDKPVTAVFLFAVLLWEAIKREAEQLREDGESEAQALRIATQEIAARQQVKIAMPRRLVQAITEIVVLQPRFDQRKGRRALRLLEHARFRAAYDLLLLRAHAGDAPEELAAWWTRIQTLGSEERAAELGLAGRKRRRRGGRRGSRSASRAEQGT